MEVNSIESLVCHLDEHRQGIIGIDGPAGAGKTTLARHLSQRLEIPCLHLDDFLTRHRGAFLEFLQYDRLSVAARLRPIIIEGVCLYAVLKRLGLAADIVIYLVPAHQQHERWKVDVGSSALNQEISAYNAAFRPSETASIVFVNRIASHKKGAGMDNGGADVDIAFIQAKTKLAIILAVGGMLALIVGLAVLLYGVTGNDRTLVKIGTMEMSASGLGGVIMTTSALWAFFAYKCRPVYARRREVTEKYDPDSRLKERREHESSTEEGIRPD
jgi:uridine kinase